MPRTIRRKKNFVLAVTGKHFAKPFLISIAQNIRRVKINIFACKFFVNLVVKRHSAKMSKHQLFVSAHFFEKIFHSVGRAFNRLTFVRAVKASVRYDDKVVILRLLHDLHVTLVVEKGALIIGMKFNSFNPVFAEKAHFTLNVVHFRVHSCKRKYALAIKVRVKI